MDLEELIGIFGPAIPPVKANARRDRADRAVTGFNHDWPIHRQIETLEGVRRCLLRLKLLSANEDEYVRPHKWSYSIDAGLDICIRL
jgi:hypothetical protein